MKIGDCITVRTSDDVVTGNYEGLGMAPDGTKVSVIVATGVEYDGFERLTDMYVDDILSVNVVEKYTAKTTGKAASKIGIPR